MRVCGLKAERGWVRAGDEHMVEFLACFLSYFAFSSLNVGEEDCLYSMLCTFLFHDSYFFTTYL